MSTRLPRALHHTVGPWLGLVLALASGAANPAEAQSAGGSIGVSLTILESVETPAVGITGFRLDRDGRATIETTAPSAGKASQIVMARVSSSADGFHPVEQPTVVLAGEGAGTVTDAGATRMSHHVNVGRATGGSAPRELQLRIEYLVVAGT